MQKPADDPILKRFRATLDELYGQRLERVVLCGSQTAAGSSTRWPIPQARTTTRVCP
jgi:hypothetical protein